jgi:hypothetical protein
MEKSKIYFTKLSVKKVSQFPFPNIFHSLQSPPSLLFSVLGKVPREWAPARAGHSRAELLGQ